jgi:uncharacterized protein
MKPDHTSGSRRLPSLDVLRGVGVLGMLATHIQSFAMGAAARSNPGDVGPLEGADRWVWFMNYVLMDGKFLPIFSVLFGASCIMLVDRANDAAIPAARPHYRRVAALFCIGLLHACLLWYGDMLMSMALCGALVFFYLQLTYRRQLVLGAILLGLGAVIGALLAGWPEVSGAGGTIDPAEAYRAKIWEISRYRGTWLEQMDHRIPAAISVVTASLARQGLWEITGLMLIGSALFRLGILSGRRSERFYAVLGGLGWGLGLPCAIYLGANLVSHAGQGHQESIAAAQLRYWGDGLIALGWLGLTLLVVRRGWPLKPLAAVGRLALTNYLLQSLICTTIFYGHGLGLFARVNRMGQVAIVAAIWAVQLAGSVWWFRWFSVGPVEWLVRRVTYGGSPANLKGYVAGEGIVA